MTPTQPRTRADLEELRRLANAATPGPWKWDTQYHDTLLSEGTGEQVLNVSGYDFGMTWRNEQTDASYIAAANPATILRLIEAVSEYREALRTILDAVYASGSRTLRSGDDIAWAIFLGANGAGGEARSLLQADHPSGERGTCIHGVGPDRDCVRCGEGQPSGEEPKDG